MCKHLLAKDIGYCKEASDLNFKGLTLLCLKTKKIPEGSAPGIKIYYTIISC